MAIHIDKATQVERDFVPPWRAYLVENWKLEADFAGKIARLIIWCSILAGMRPTITSGYRSASEQQRLVDEYKKGNPNVMTPLPPGKSLHQATTWLGAPASLACDIVFSPDNRNYKAGNVAKQLGIVWAGGKDWVHFAARGGTL